MSITIRSGDTLSGLAARFKTSVAALMQANPSIKNANLIYAGRNLNIPGAKDEFVASTSKAGGTSMPTAMPTGAPSVGADSFVPAGQDPLAFAKSVMGRNASELKLSSGAIGQGMQDWVPNNVNCANFVSACLMASGQIDKSQHSASVYGLMGNLDKDADFKRVSLQNAKPGDVVSMKTKGGQHVVLFAGWQNGKPMFIGSNNVNSDGSQKVSLTSMNYPILAVHQRVA
ncbi:MAG: LysM peptidoglycan-binding domain-containing protein [Myxococcaceae bacterium]